MCAQRTQTSFSRADSGAGRCMDLLRMVEPASSAYAGDHGLGRRGMRVSGGNDRDDESAMLRRISHGGG